MNNSLCQGCYSRGYCRRRVTHLVNDGDLFNPEYIRDLRASARRRGLTCDQWIEALADWYRDYPGWIADDAGREVFLDLDVFERPNIRDWFRSFCNTPCPPHIRPHVRPEARERVRVLATILSFVIPAEAALWGHRSANDNYASSNDNAPLAQA
ncbi:MAG: hypothetical protein AAFY84_12765 [Pseudomonadota bacterium]